MSSGTFIILLPTASCLSALPGRYHLQRRQALHLRSCLNLETHRHEISFSLVVIQRLHNHLSASHAFSTRLLYNCLLSQMINYDAELGGCLGRHPRAIFCKRPATQEGDGFDEPKSRFQCVVSVHTSSPDFLRLYAFLRSYGRATKSSKSHTACAAC